MELTKEDINLMIQSLEELEFELTEECKGTLFSEQFELLDKLKNIYKTM